MNWWIDETPPRQGDIEPFDGVTLPRGWSIPDRGDLNARQELIKPDAPAYRNSRNPDPRAAQPGDLIWTRSGIPAGVILSVNYYAPMQYGHSYEYEYVILCANYDHRDNMIEKDFRPKFDSNPVDAADAFWVIP